MTIFKPKSENEARKMISKAMRDPSIRIKRITKNIVEINHNKGITYVDEKSLKTVDIFHPSRKYQSKEEIVRMILKTFCE